MNQCTRHALTFVPNEDGASVAEYAAMAALVAVAIMRPVSDIDIVLDHVFTLIGNALDYMMPALGTATRLILSLLSLVL